MEKRTAAVAYAEGLHARPATLFAKAVAKSGKSIAITKGEVSVDASSALMVMTLGIGQGDTVTLSSSENGAAATLDELAVMLERGEE